MWRKPKLIEIFFEDIIKMTKIPIISYVKPNRFSPLEDIPLSI